jgi:heme exporter protein B
MKHLMREFYIMNRQKQSLLQSVLFFLMFTAFFPLTLPYDTSMLRLMCPGIIWLAFVLSIYLASERFFSKDIQNGCLEKWLVFEYPLIIYVSIKIAVHGLLNLMAIILISPLVAIFYHLTITEWCALIASLSLGMPGLVSMCALVSAFGSYGQDRAIVMLLVLFPLILPILMLGSSLVSAALQSLPIAGYLALSAALSIGILLVIPFACAMVLKIGLEHGS